MSYLGGPSTVEWRGRALEAERVGDAAAQARVPPAEQQEVAKVHVGASGNACHEYP